jgi:hypothetical protein
VNIQSSTVFGVPIIPPLNIVATDTLLCPGEAGTTLVVPQVPNATYNWKRNGVNYYFGNPQTPFVALGGMYLLILSDGCTTAYDSIQIIRDSLDVTISATGSTSFCQGDSVMLSSTPANLNSWQWRNKSYPIPGANNAVYYAKTAGKYYCIGMDLLGCTDTSNIISVSVPCIPIGPNQQKDIELESVDRFDVYPNPSNGIVEIRSGPGYLKVYDSTGREVHSLRISGGEISLDLSQYEKGTYYLTLLTPEKYFRKLLQIH